jgi:hypothetical protein
MVTRDRGPQPTVEVPFPQALDASPVPSSTRPASASANAAAVTEIVPIPTFTPPPPPPPASAKPAVAKPAPAPKPAPVPRAPKTPISQQLRTTLTNVRSSPVWRRSIPPPVFIAVVALFVIGLLGTVVALRAQQPDVPVVDTKLEARRARERQLRLEGELLLRQGRVTDAYPVYEELHRLAPKSPFVTNVMANLNAMRQREEISRQSIAQAQLKFQEGIVLVGEKKYAEAILRLQESLQLNPNSVEVNEALKNAQELETARLAEAERLRRQQRQTGRTPPATTTSAEQTATTATQAPVPAEPAQMTTVFNHNFTDGRILVRVGSDIAANDALYTERRRRVIGTLARDPKQITVTKSFPSKSADVEVVITIPSASISERHTIPGVRFEAGTSYRLVVRYIPATKKFTYVLN